MTTEAPNQAVRNALTLAAEIEHLRHPEAYPEHPWGVETIETHMSWVFLTDSLVYKLKKPVRYGWSDLRRLAARRINCERETALNRRLARNVYLGTMPLAIGADGRLSLGGSGVVVDWLVVMRRLPRERALDHLLCHGPCPTASQARQLALHLARFFKRCAPVPVTVDSHFRAFQREIGRCVRALTATGFAPEARRIAHALRRFLRHRADSLVERVRNGRIVDGHGDLRPEHVFLERSPLVIDCLEFAPALRALDPADELAFLAMECERLGGPWIGPVLFQVYARSTGDAPPAGVVAFYKSYRAFIRARLAACHLMESPSDPARWRLRTADYLRLATIHLRHRRMG